MIVDETPSIFPSLFSNLPDELLVEIFLNCVEPDDIGCVAPSNGIAPLLLTRVCRRWRQIAISCPDLWTGLAISDIDINKSLVKNSMYALGALELWISRSGPRPISFSISYTDKGSRKPAPTLFLPDKEDYLKGLNKVIEKLLTCQSRWRALELEVIGLTMLRPILQALGTSPGAPLLESFQVSTSHLEVFGETLSCDFGVCSNLRDIKILSQVVVPPTTGHVLQNLKELELDYCSNLDACLQWLDKAPNMESFKTKFCTFDSVVDRTLHPHSIRKLEKLKILEVSFLPVDSDPSVFLDCLELPALQDLYIKYNENVGMRSVVELLLRSKPPALEALSLLGASNVPDVIDCLRLTPSLTYLYLQKMPDELMHALMVPEDTNLSLNKDTISISGNIGTSEIVHRAPLCPLLEVLEIEDSEECSQDLLAELAVSRCTSKYVQEATDGAGVRVSGGRYKTLETLIVSHDPQYRILRHPRIAHCLVKGMDVVQRPPGGFHDDDDDDDDDEDFDGDNDNGDGEGIGDEDEEISIDDHQLRA